MSARRHVIGVPRGRLLKPSLSYLASRGITPRDLDEGDRRLTIPTNFSNVFLAIIRPWDCPAFLSAGAVDLAIMGTDVIAERTSEGDLDYVELPFGHCHLSLIGPRHAKLGSVSGLRIATRHQTLAKSFLEGFGIDNEIVPLDGSHEAAILLGFADVAIDIVETGRTLRENDLTELHRIRSFNAALVAPRTRLAATMNQIGIATSNLN